MTNKQVETERHVDKRRIALFLFFAYGIAWLASGIVYWLGGLQASGEIVPGLGITWGIILVALLYMPAPAVAHGLTRIVTGEGWSGVDLRLRLRRNWKLFLLAWFVVPPLMTILGGALFFWLFPQAFDPSMRTITMMLDQLAPGATLPPLGILFVAQLVQALLLGGLINSIFTFGEEFGWRGYLQAKLLPLGWRKAMLWMGVIWGLWHAPVIAMGHNYGMNYPGAPWSGILAMVWFCFVVGTFLGWLQLRSQSVWLPTIAHASINAISGLAVLFVQGEPNSLLGPMPTGLIAGVAWSVLAFWLLWKGNPLEQHGDDYHSSIVTLAAEGATR